MSEPVLEMWTIYDHPSDLPDFYVARRFLIVKGEPEPVADRAVAHKDIERLRALMREMGLVKLMRNDVDPPQVVETWI